METINFSDFITANKGRFQFINNWFCVQDSVFFSLHRPSQEFHVKSLFEANDGLYPNLIEIAKNPFFHDKGEYLFEVYRFLFEYAAKNYQGSDLQLDNSTYNATINLVEQYLELNSLLVNRLYYNPVKLLTQLLESDREKNATEALNYAVTF